MHNEKIMRFELKKGFRRQQVGEWMNHHIGPYEDGVTWFWSAGECSVEYQSDGSSKEVVFPEGVNIWKDDPRAVTMAILRWS